MIKDNLDPNGQSRPFWKILFDNRGFVSIGDGDGGSDDGSGGNSDDGASGGDGDGGGGTATGTATDWRTNLDESIRQHPALEKFKTPYDVAKSYIEIQKLVGRDKIPMPSADSDPMSEAGAKDWDIVFSRLGRPENPESYDLPEIQYPENFPTPSEEQVAEFKGLAHKLGLLPHQVAALYKWDSERNLAFVEQHQQQLTETAQRTEADLRKKYGQAFDANIGAARNLVHKLGGQDLISVLDETGMGNNPVFIDFAVKIAKHFGEDASTFIGETESAIMTPTEAQAEIAKIRGNKDHPYHAHNRDNPEHDAAVERMSQLFEMAYPGGKKE